MTTNSIATAALITTLCVIFAGGLPGAASAGGGLEPLVILDVEADVASQTLTIHGLNFDNGAAPQVLLDEQPLFVSSYGAGEIVAALPAWATAGDFRLSVQTGPKNQHYAVYDLSIGVSGPRGDKGERGDKGPQGDTGPAPAHQWDGTALRLEEPVGTWGAYVDLQGPQGEQGWPAGYSWEKQVSDTIDVGGFSYHTGDYYCDYGEARWGYAIYDDGDYAGSAEVSTRFDGSHFYIHANLSGGLFGISYKVVLLCDEPAIIH